MSSFWRPTRRIPGIDASSRVVTVLKSCSLQFLHGSGFYHDAVTVYIAIILSFVAASCTDSCFQATFVVLYWYMVLLSTLSHTEVKKFLKKFCVMSHPVHLPLFSICLPSARPRFSSEFILGQKRLTFKTLFFFLPFLFILSPYLSFPFLIPISPLPPFFFPSETVQRQVPWPMNIKWQRKEMTKIITSERAGILKKWQGIE